MPRKILIIGAGQSGLQLALGLQQHGYEVTVMSARTADEIRTGRVMSTQGMFDTALQIERDLGLNFWEEACPPFEGVQFSLLAPDGGRGLAFTGRFDAYGQSIDQRVKMSGWLETFESRGGKVIIHGATVSDLDRLISLYDLVVVSAGKSELMSVFGRDASRSPYTTPQRGLAAVYVHGLGPRAEDLGLTAVDFNMLPGLGELFIIPAFTTSGPCDILFFEVIPDGPLDCWSDIRTPEDQLKRTLELIEKFVPWQHERTREVELTDWGGTLMGRFAPVVRYPVAKLPSGGAALGMADVVVTNDPIVAQGSNNASKCAATYLNAILEHGDRPFDETFMQRTFDSFWDYVQYSVIWTNAMLQPPPPHIVEILGAASRYPQVANRLVNGFNNPRDFFEWLMDPGKAAAYLAEVASQAAASDGGD